MALRRGRLAASSQEGFALIEVVISALIVVATTGGVVTLLSATGRSGAEQRHRAQAFSIAQEDQARMRAIQITSLNNAMKPQTVTLNGTPYTVTSSSSFVSDKTGSTKCTGTSVSADYVRLGSKVTWPQMRAAPVILESIVAPVSGSLDPYSGSLAITVKNAAVQGVAEAGLSGTGAGTFSGYTDSEGCALFGGLPSGSYTLTPSLSSEYVDFNGKAPATKSITVTAGNVTPIALEYDRAGKVNLNFQVKKPIGSEFQPSNSEAVVAFSTGIQGETKAFWSSNKQLANTVVAEPLYPFTYSYSFYAGSCTENKPTSASGEATAIVTPGGEVTKTITLPGLYLKVKTSGGAAIPNARVTIKDNKCPESVKREYLTDLNGALPNPGLPSSTSYAICASAPVAGVPKRMTTTKEVRSLTGTSLEMTLSSNATACP
jgi:Tfp pilus assembly protein PilV